MSEINTNIEPIGSGQRQRSMSKRELWIMQKVTIEGFFTGVHDFLTELECPSIHTGFSAGKGFSIGIVVIPKSKNYLETAVRTVCNPGVYVNAWGHTAL